MIYGMCFLNKLSSKGEKMANIGDIHMMRSVADKLKGKSDEELVEEIKKIKAVMGGDEEKIRKQLEAIKPFRQLLDEEQQKKFDTVIKALLED